MRNVNVRVYLVAFLGGVGLVAGLLSLSSQPPLAGSIKEKPDKVLKKEFRGIPTGTKLEWDNGKYVPKSVPGYESKADYPDSFWIYDEAALTGKVK